MQAELKIKAPDHLKRDSGIHCQKCGAELWLYLGETKREWDSYECCHVDAVQNTTLPCHVCREMFSRLVGQAAMLRFLRNQAGADLPKDMKPEVREKILAKKEAGVESFMRAFHANCDALKVVPAQVNERLYTIEANRAKHRGE